MFVRISCFGLHGMLGAAFGLYRPYASSPSGNRNHNPFIQEFAAAAPASFFHTSLDLCYLNPFFSFFYTKPYFFIMLSGRDVCSTFLIHILFFYIKIFDYTCSPSLLFPRPCAPDFSRPTACDFVSESSFFRPRTCFVAAPGLPLPAAPGFDFFALPSLSFSLQYSLRSSVLKACLNPLASRTAAVLRQLGHPLDLHPSYRSATLSFFPTGFLNVVRRRATFLHVRELFPPFSFPGPL